MADNQPAATPAVAAAAKVKNPSVEAGINAITSPAAEKSYYEGVQKKQDALSASQAEGLKKFGARMGDVESARKAELSEMPKVEAPKETKFDHKGASELSSLMLVFGALAGRKTATPLTAALGNMAAAMEGHVAGDAERFERESKQFKENFDLGMKNYENYIKGQQAIIEKHNGDRANIEREQKQFALENGVSAEMIANSVTNHKDYLNTLYKAEEGRLKAKEHAATMAGHAEDLIKKRRENALFESGSAGDTASGLASAAMGGLPISRKAVPAAVAEIHKLHPEIPTEEIAQKMEIVTEMNNGRKKQIEAKGKVIGFEKTVLKNIEQLEAEFQKQKDLGDRSDIPMVNSLRDRWRTMTGIPYNEAVNLYGQEIAAELSKLASSATAAGSGGTLTDREEWRAFFKKDSSFDQMKKSIATARQAANFRIQATDEAIKQATDEINGLWGASSKTAASSSGGKQVYSSKSELDSAIKSRKIKQGDTFFDPDGNTHEVQ